MRPTDILDMAKRNTIRYAISGISTTVGLPDVKMFQVLGCYKTSCTQQPFNLYFDNLPCILYHTFNSLMITACSAWCLYNRKEQDSNILLF
jgi:hypothetical protein